MIKKLLKLFWRAGVDEIKPPMRQLMTEDEFSKNSLISDEGDYDDMSQLIDKFGKSLEEEEVDSVFNNLKGNQRNQDISMKKLMFLLCFLSSYSLSSFSFEDQLENTINTDDSRLRKVEEIQRKKCKRTFPNYGNKLRKKWVSCKKDK